ncbi:MAG: NifU family protein [Bacteroidetes bacterium]|nr:NifU family protein [Bacteroidota bacterium]MCB0842963.1 NifU family protein [Bacteroidota bacterium]
MNNELKTRIDEALESVRGYLRSDGGDVRVHRITEDGVVELELLGSCESCSMSNMTMKAGLEQVIFRVAPEIKKVVAVNLTH